MELNQNPDMLEVMEADLRDKIQNAIVCNPELNMVVHGVFSVDDLEQKMESDLGGKIGVGVQYAGADRLFITDREKDGVLNPGKGNAARTLKFHFSVILGVPTIDSDTTARHPATKLLSVLRGAVLGKAIDDGGRATRTWDFVSESPQHSASTKTMLYYAQVWQVVLQQVTSLG